MPTKLFKNTFAPHVDNDELPVSAIILGLSLGVFHYDELPSEVQDAVDEEMARRETLEDDETQ
ncbi:hypothetical protein [Nitrososphaera sp.]|uniref:hypothetical protein n=1 Tax=Nitrososphaera sp. TaxID=1971748 RepID=UPI0017C56FD2|nr:hypothetical protein [Nitrososphaera sp.]NWG38090.1 hypothetical protein [Nitrososphaera sp.]